MLIFLNIGMNVEIFRVYIIPMINQIYSRLYEECLNQLKIGFRVALMQRVLKMHLMV